MSKWFIKWNWIFGVFCIIVGVTNIIMFSLSGWNTLHIASTSFVWFAGLFNISINALIRTKKEY
jgi:hypothetical protein